MTEYKLDDAIELYERLGYVINQVEESNCNEAWIKIDRTDVWRKELYYGAEEL